jgi:molybdopterin synthase sulfur carrier subunit
MKITVLTFGVAKDIMKGAAVDLDVAEELNAAGLNELLKTQYPQLKALRSFFIAVNGSYAAPSQLLHPGDEIAIIPPVSGG